ncbi:MAG: 50S ribosomal protein L9 [Halanaerobiales bacterium]
MKVILRKDVKKLGSKGDIVKVSDGYARNYLIPKGMADEATAGNLNQLKHKEKVQQRKEAENIAEAKEMAGKLEKEKFVISVKAGENGRLFGSVTTKDIADTVNKAGYKIDKRKIDLDEHIKSLGVHNIKVKLYQDVEANLKIQVVEA